jgi:hypothetical protein
MSEPQIRWRIALKKMSRREKLILSIMVITVLLGGVSVYFGPSVSRTLSVGGRNSAKQAMQFAREAIQKFKADDSIAKDLFSMRSAERAWQRDPFVDATTALSDNRMPARLEKKPATDRSPLNLTYTGYIEAGTQRLAIINGIEYSTGEAIDAQGHYVRRIQPHQVDIGKRDATDRIILKYSESGLVAGQSSK